MASNLDMDNAAITANALADEVRALIADVDRTDGAGLTGPQTDATLKRLNDVLENLERFRDSPGQLLPSFRKRVVIPGPYVAVKEPVA